MTYTFCLHLVLHLEIRFSDELNCSSREFTEIFPNPPFGHPTPSQNLKKKRSRVFQRVLGGRFGILNFFSARGRGRGNPRRQGGEGGQFFVENPRSVVGGSPGKGGEGAGRVSAGNLGGGGLIFFWGRNSRQKSAFCHFCAPKSRKRHSSEHSLGHSVPGAQDHSKKRSLAPGHSCRWWPDRKKTIGHKIILASA